MPLCEIMATARKTRDNSLTVVFSVQSLELVKSAQLSRLKSGGSDSSEVVTDPLQVFHQAINNCKPIMGTTGVRRGGKLYHVSVHALVSR